MSRQGHLHWYSADFNKAFLDVVLFLGPLIKYAVFDALFGLLSSLLLIFGGLNRSASMLMIWLLVTLVSSVKYVWVVVTHDWSDIEDWIAITYLLFYILVIIIVASFLSEITSWRRNSEPAFSKPYNGEMKFSTFVDGLIIHFRTFFNPTKCCDQPNLHSPVSQPCARDHNSYPLSALQSGTPWTPDCSGGEDNLFLPAFVNCYVVCSH